MEYMHVSTTSLEDQLKETRALLELRERQLADCTRAMFSACMRLTALPPKDNEDAEEIAAITEMLASVRAGK